LERFEIGRRYDTRKQFSRTAFPPVKIILKAGVITAGLKVAEEIREFGSGTLRDRYRSRGGTQFLESAVIKTQC
jgi:hypothetical protein